MKTDTKPHSKYDRAGIARRHGLTRWQNYILWPVSFGFIFVFFVGISALSDMHVLDDMEGTVVSMSEDYLQLHITGVKVKQCRYVPGTIGGLVKSDVEGLWTAAEFISAEDPKKVVNRAPGPGRNDFGFWAFRMPSGIHPRAVRYLRITLVYVCPNDAPTLESFTFEIIGDQARQIAQASAVRNKIARIRE